MSYILSIETATKTCSVALSDEQRLITHQDLHLDKSHSGSLTNMINHLVATAGITLADLAAVAVSKGPGSYTGLRIGMSTAKGLCYARDLPLISVGTLESMAWHISRYNPAGALLCPMIDARRMEVYCLLMDHQLQVLEPVHALVVEEGAFAERLQKQPILFFGDGAPKCAPVFDAQPNAHILPHVLPTAVGVAGLAWQKYQQQDFADLAYSEPFYLKEFQAKKPKKLL